MTISKRDAKPDRAPAPTSCSGLTRRRFLAGSGVAVAATAGVTLIGSRRSRAATKTSKENVKYQASPKDGNSCATCEFFEPEQKTCKIVEGEIAAEGWCVSFVKKQ